jgi:hypothetical protein
MIVQNPAVEQLVAASRYAASGGNRKVPYEQDSHDAHAFMGFECRSRITVRQGREYRPPSGQHDGTIAGIGAVPPEPAGRKAFAAVSENA